MGRSKIRPAFLSEREWVCIQALEKHQGNQHYAALEMGVSNSAVQSSVSRIRKKMESAYKFKRIYGHLIERNR
jgi:predicted DNA-binding protein (UPF0251 family)